MPRPRVPEDDGSVDPELASAVLAHSADAARLPDVLAALHAARVLAPVVALLQESDVSPAGLRVEKMSDIALPLLLDPEGRKAVLVFSSLDSLHRWDRSARPVPVTGPQAARVVLSEGAEGMVLDVAGPAAVTLGLPEVRALADGRGVVPAYDDAGLAREVARVLADDSDVIAAWIAPGPGVDAVLSVTIDPSVAPEAVGSRLAGALGAPALRAAAVRGLDLVLQRGSASAPSGRPVYDRTLS